MATQLSRLGYSNTYARLRKPRWRCSLQIISEDFELILASDTPHPASQMVNRKNVKDKMQHIGSQQPQPHLQRSKRITSTHQPQLQYSATPTHQNFGVPTPLQVLAKQSPQNDQAPASPQSQPQLMRWIHAPSFQTKDLGVKSLSEVMAKENVPKKMASPQLLMRWIHVSLSPLPQPQLQRYPQTKISGSLPKTSHDDNHSLECGKSQMGGQVHSRSTSSMCSK